MRVFGLTGQTGAGKSTVALHLAQRGFLVIDGDKVARRVTENGSPALCELCACFGDDILFEDGSLNRKKLAERAFSSKENTALLNAVTHPYIDAVFKKELERGKKAGYRFALIDAAALLESPSRVLCEKVIAVICPKEIRLERILLRDGITRREALRRMEAQKDEEYYKKNADIIIRNYPPYEVQDEAEAFLKEVTA